ncbi:dihydroneopterin aldolase [Hellea balneolensis]|uniref:dihydroneopterin aldolase n=1 Tax=Hellea balneolensis TaxID=287478 RepID=UPI0003FB50B3|nr:dihydroneopterin aldolase [Hellea balneolensis]
MLKVLNNTGLAQERLRDDLPCDQILIEGLVLPAFIGVFEHEYEAPQSVRFDITVDITPLGPHGDHEMHNILRYDHIVDHIKEILAKGHIDLVETLAEDVAKACLSYDRAEQVCVTAAKLEAIKDARAVGVRITRRR